MANFTAREQLMLELINRARMDPKGEAARFGITVNEGVDPGDQVTTSPKQVLAGNDALGLAADKHTSWMLANDKLQHDEIPGTAKFYDSDPSLRVFKAGYPYASASENIAMMSSSGTIDDTKSISNMYKLLFVDASDDGRGHRMNILTDYNREIGVGHGMGSWHGQDASVITTDFARNFEDSTFFITGVVYNDTKKNDDFFTVGEQQSASISDEGSSASDTTGAGGGYELGFATSGTKTITFDLETGDVIVDVAFHGRNVKVDLVNGDEIWTNASSLTSLSTDIEELHALGISKLKLVGSDAGEKIFGNAGANKLNGNGGKDGISGGDGKDTITGGAGKDTMTGGDGNDKFVFKAEGDSSVDKPDVIKDFGRSGIDRIDLSALGDLTYRDEHKINGVNQVNVTKDGNDVVVHINLDADKTEDEMRITLHNTGLSSMSAADFIL